MSYFIKFIIKNFKPKKDVIQFIKNNADLSDIDLKNEQILKHLFKHLFELYINVNEDEDKNVVDTEKGGTGGKRFTPPLQEEVILYCEERNNNVDPVKWYNFYQAKDWKIGKNKMADWKAAVRTWENNNSDGKNKPNNAKSKEFDLSRFEGYSDEKTN